MGASVTRSASLGEKRCHLGSSVPLTPRRGRRYSGSAETAAWRRPSVITCPKCSKDNQDHYKFCLGCGAELPRDAAPKPFSPQTPPQGIKAVQAPAAATAAPAAAAASSLGATVATTSPAPAPKAAATASIPANAPVPAASTSVA